MRKTKIILIFIVVLLSSLFLIDNLLFGSLGISCHCLDSILLETECWGACINHGGCDFPLASQPGGCNYGTNECTHLVWNICNDGEFIGGYHWYRNCIDCYDDLIDI